MKRLVGKSIAVAYVLCSVVSYGRTQPINPGAVWLDDRGQQIQAHGAGILEWGDTYYWFGEDRSVTNDPLKRYVACYSSDDLVHWEFRRQVAAWEDVAHLGSHWVLERPKVFYNSTTKKFVMYAHIDNAAYKFARVAVATSDTVDGDYQFLKSYRPFGQESRDIGQFVDDDGAAYLIFESRPTQGFFIARLSDDYLDVAQEPTFVSAPLEGGALVQLKDFYYVIGSHMTGWAPNPGVYATSKSVEGPWTEFRDIAPPEANTYDSQSSMLLKVTGSKQTTVIFMGDIWKPNTLWDSRYFWMPLEIGGGIMHLPAPCPWSLDIKTGSVQFHP